MALLQETHLDATLQAQRQHLMGGQTFFSHGEANRAGVGIVCGPKLTPTHVTFRETVKGHLIAAEFVLGDVRLRVVNVYAPSASRERGLFFSGALRDTLEEADSDGMLTVVRSDLNFTLDPALDRNGARNLRRV